MYLLENIFKSLERFMYLGGLMVSEQKKKEEFLRVKIDLPSFQFELVTEDPSVALPELRKILETLQLDEEVIYEEFVVQELRAELSENFINNQQVMTTVRKLLKQEEDYRIGRANITTTATIDLDHQTRDVRVQKVEVKRAISKIVEEVDTNAVKQGIIHIQGDVAKDDKVLIVDHIHRCMPTAQLRAFQSTGPASQVTVECIFFGEFQENDEE
jgi:hypothetical protein